MTQQKPSEIFEGENSSLRKTFEFTLSNFSNEQNSKISLSKWEKSVNELRDCFVKMYFGEEVEMWWVADEVGGVLQVNDYFFNLHDIVDYIRYDYSKEDMFGYYDYCVDMPMGDRPINIKNWRKLK